MIFPNQLKPKDSPINQASQVFIGKQLGVFFFHTCES